MLRLDDGDEVLSCSILARNRVSASVGRYDDSLVRVDSPLFLGRDDSLGIREVSPLRFMDWSLRLDDDEETLGSRTPRDGSTLLDVSLGEADPEIGGVIGS